MGLTRRDFIKAFMAGGAVVAAQPMAQALRAIAPTVPEALPLAERLEAAVAEAPYVDSVNVSYRVDVNMMATQVHAMHHDPATGVGYEYADLYDAQDAEELDMEAFVRRANEAFKRAVKAA